MSRSKWKGPTFKNSFLQIKNKKGNHFRAGIILPVLNNNMFKVYNGLTYYSLFITNPLVGYSFGNFVLTRKKYKYKKS